MTSSAALGDTLSGGQNKLELSALLPNAMWLTSIVRDMTSGVTAPVGVPVDDRLSAFF